MAEKKKTMHKLKTISTEYLITNDMLGPCYKVTSNMSHENLKKEFEQGHYIHPNIDKYYKISYVYQESIPVPTKNQLVCPGRIWKNDNGKIDYELSDINTNIYTLLSRRYDDDVVAVITNEDDEVIKFEMFNVNNNYYTHHDFKKCPLLETKRTIYGTIYNSLFNNENCFIIKERYFKHCYFVELPFHVNDGLYNALSLTNMDFLVLVKDRKLYFFIWYVSNDGIEISKIENLPITPSFTIRLCE